MYVLKGAQQEIRDWTRSVRSDGKDLKAGGEDPSREDLAIDGELQKEAESQALIYIDPRGFTRDCIGRWLQDRLSQFNPDSSDELNATWRGVGMHNSTCLYPLVASLTLGAAIFLATAGSEANAQELDWATSAGSGIFDSGLGIATDPRGNSYVTGIIRGSPFGVGVEDVFVAKYARDGSLVWNTSSAGTSRELGIGIAADARGNSYVTGEFEETATFGAGEAMRRTHAATAT
jgi:hypothetical protein